MDFEDAAFLALMFVVFGVPAVAIAARLAIRPIVEAIVRLREVFVVAPGAAPSEQRLARLEAEIEALRAAVASLSEEAAFDRQLQASGDLAVHLPGPGSRDRQL